MFSETYDGEMLSSIMTKYLTYTDVSTIVSKWRHSTVNVESFELLKLRSERSALMLYVLIVTSVVIIGAIFYQYLIKKQNIDDLTRTFNRKALMKQRFNHSILFSLIDIDNFKSINDVFGPKVGDEVLIAFSARLQKRFGKSNVYRIGGDDFVAIVPVDSKSDIESIELFNVIQKELIEPLNVNGRQIILQCSLGIASSVISKVNTPEKLLIEADNALMIAKEKGANTTLYLSEDIHQKLQYEQFLQNEFKYAFAYDEITPFYQPLIDLKNNKVIGYEALARWIYQYDTIFTPHTFLPYAKRLAIIDQLDFLVLRKALSTFNEMRDENLVENDFLVSVNFSHATLTLLDILDITRLADSYNVEYGNIEIEILEDVILDSLIKDKIKKLHQLGFKISLDDFSAGHSSLKSFVEYDLNILKIDRMLIPNLHSDSVEFSIYKTIVDLANHANIKVIAEGIETVDQLEYLKDLNVDYGQGYYYSKPMPKEDFKNYIENYDELQH
jgi:two-component system CheB/CheR fusion protein